MVKENTTPETGGGKTEKQLLEDRKSQIDKRLKEIADASLQQRTVTDQGPLIQEETALRGELSIINTKLGLNG